ncbi:unnamed protein product [Symbiodinium sp. CCMP2592]|nr:unnamed protein product [Symbiodinium sp. CCMP2592]
MARSCEFSSILPGEATLPSKSLEPDDVVRPQIVITPPRRAVDVTEPREKPLQTPPVDDRDRSPAGNLQLPGSLPKTEVSDPEDPACHAGPQSSSVFQDHECEQDRLQRRPSYSSQRSRRSDGSSKGDSEVTEKRSRYSQGSKRRGSFTVARVSMDTAKSPLDRVPFADGVECAMQLYLEDSCEDGSGTASRTIRMWVVLLGLLLLVSALAFWSLMIPFAPPEAGFWENWRFNFVAVPSMMYVFSRSGVLLLFRSISPSERTRMRSKSLWLPVVGPVVCIAIQTIAGALGVFPLPYLILTAAIPAQTVALIVARLSVPPDLLSTEVRKWWTYVTFCFIAYPSQSMLFMLWLAVFPELTEVLQVLGSFALNGLLAVSAVIMEWIGLWLRLPVYLLYEIKVMILFVSFLYTAALLSSAKSVIVLALMLAQDAAKAVAIFLKMCYHLLAIVEIEHIGQNDTHTCSTCSSCSCHTLGSLLVTPSELLALRRRKWSLMLDCRDRLRDIFTIFQLHTRESLQEADLALADVRLLGGFTRCIVVLGLVELCEVLVPLLYMILATMLHVLGGNREYIYLFDDVELWSALVGNGFGFLIEISVLLLLQAALCSLIGFNLLNFVTHVLRMDFSYWTAVLSTCLEGWIVVLLSHGGHDLEAIRDWLSI